MVSNCTILNVVSLINTECFCTAQVDQFNPKTDLNDSASAPEDQQQESQPGLQGTRGRIEGMKGVEQNTPDTNTEEEAELTLEELDWYYLMENASKTTGFLNDDPRTSDGSTSPVETTPVLLVNKRKKNKGHHTRKLQTNSARKANSPDKLKIINQDIEEKYR